ncbi:hypothetical protein Bca4012_071732 [Brassica carinata]
MASYLHVVTFIGFLSLLRLLYPLLKWFITRFLLTDPRRLKSYGSWAMVTGATDGIGRAFAHELAKHGLNLILVSRNPSKLASVSDDFRQEFPQIKIKIIPFDFSSGFLSLLRLLYPLLKWFITRFLLTDPRRLKSYGSWAMVTGATDGIGRAFAHELAKHGLNLILVSRNPSKLASVSDDFRQEFPQIKIKIIPFDFSSGFLSLLRLLYPLLKWFITRFLLTDPRRLKSYGSWAMVTGATDGIGRAFAHELAKHGLNLILVSRNPSKLASVSDDFRQEFPQIKIKIIPFDFSSERGYEAIEEGIKGLEVGILINNVGITYPRAMFFHELDQLTWTKILRVNLEATTWVTRSLIGPMLHRRRGAIINISSGAAVVVPSHPLYAIYAATKAYVDKLSRSLHVEYKQFGIHVQCQVPLYVATRMVSEVADIDKPSFFVPSPEVYAKAAVEQIGIGSRCSPFWAHSLQWFLAGLLPENLLDTWRLSVGLRRRGLS